jgi:phosphoglucosamine mutase
MATATGSSSSTRGGTIYDGDQLLYAIVKQRAGREKVAGVAGTLMTNLALEQAFGRMQVPFARAAVGDRYVLELMRERKWLFGGENSGHIICLDRHTTGDGIIFRAAGPVRAALDREVPRRADRRSQDVSAGARQRESAARVRLEAHTAIAQAQTEAERSMNGAGTRIAAAVRNRAGAARDGGRRAARRDRIGAQSIAAAVRKAAG